LEPLPPQSNQQNAKSSNSNNTGRKKEQQLTPYAEELLTDAARQTIIFSYHYVRVFFLCDAEVESVRGKGKEHWAVTSVSIGLVDVILSNP